MDDHKQGLLEKVIYDEDRFTPDETIERFKIDTLPSEKFDIPKEERPCRADLRRAVSKVPHEKLDEMLFIVEEFIGKESTLALQICKLSNNAPRVR